MATIQIRFIKDGMMEQVFGKTPHGVFATTG